MTRDAPTTPVQDEAARTKLAIIGALSADEVAEMPITVVYELLRQFDEGLWPPKE
jgi:hypothetical protein